MNWDAVFQCVQSIAGLKRDFPEAIVRLRREVMASSQLSAGEKDELQLVLDGLHQARQQSNLYRQIALVGRLKEVLSGHTEFKAVSGK